MKKITFKKLLILPFILCGFLGLSQTTIIAINDSYIWNNQASTNYGSSKLIISNDTDASSHIRQVYLKFPIGSLTSVSSAKVILTLENSIATTRTYAAYKIDNADTWSNDFITWNNAPSASGGIIATGVHVGDKVEFDVTSLLASYVANSETLISIKIVSTEEDVASPIYSTDTAPSSSEKPSLVVSQTTLSVGSKALSSNDNVIVYPNPVNNELYIKGIDNVETTVSIYNTVGQLLKEERYNSNVDLSTFKAGLYYAKIKNELGQKTVSFLKK